MAVTDSGVPGHSETNAGLSGADFTLLGTSVVASAFGWYAVGKWMEPTDVTSQVLLAILRTLFTLAPAFAGFWIANRRRERLQRQMAEDLERLRGLMNSYEQLVSVDHQLRTMESLSKVARQAVISTANSANALYHAISEMPGAPGDKKMVIERFRNHSNSVMTTLNAVQEQMNEIGAIVADHLSAHEEKPIIERKTANAESGLVLAQRMIESRGIGDGLKMFSGTIEQAQKLQDELGKGADQLQSANQALLKGDT